MKINEKYLAAIICAVAFILLSNYFYRATPTKHLDSVFLFESSLSILQSGHPTSATVTSWPEALQTFTLPVEKLCQSDLRTKATTHYSLLDNHAYFALYPISLLTALAGPELTFAMANALAHLLLLIFPFIFFRRHGVDTFSSLVFVFCLVLFPGWSHSAVGDYYLDRLSMPFVMLALYLMQSMLTHLKNQLVIEKWRLFLYVSALIVAALFTERTALMIILQIVFFLFFFPEVRQTSPLRNAMLAVLALLGCYLFFYFKFVFDGIPSGGSLSESLLAFLQAPFVRLRHPLMRPFVLVNLLFLGFFVLFSGFRYWLLLLLAVMPNVIITIGGAELNGWSTHYHTTYLPFLFFAASVGYLKWMQRLNSPMRRYALSAGICCYSVLLSGFLNPWSAKYERRPFESAKLGLAAQVTNYYLQSTKGLLYPHFHHYRLTSQVTPISLWNNLSLALNAIIPTDAKVSVTEEMMASLYKNRKLSYYPIDLDQSDYLVIGGLARDGQPFFSDGAISYLGQAEAIALNQCLLQRINAKGFTLLKFIPIKEIPNKGFLIFERTKIPATSSSVVDTTAMSNDQRPAPLFKLIRHTTHP